MCMLLLNLKLEDIKGKKKFLDILFRIIKLFLAILFVEFY